jgi:hypothetical protein
LFLGNSYVPNQPFIPRVFPSSLQHLTLSQSYAKQIELVQSDILSADCTVTYLK